MGFCFKAYLNLIPISMSVCNSKQGVGKKTFASSVAMDLQQSTLDISIIDLILEEHSPEKSEIPSMVPQHAAFKFPILEDHLPETNEFYSFNVRSFFLMIKNTFQDPQINICELPTSTSSIDDPFPGTSRAVSVKEPQIIFEQPTSTSNVEHHLPEPSYSSLKETEQTSSLFNEHIPVTSGFITLKETEYSLLQERLRLLEAECSASKAKAEFAQKSVELMQNRMLKLTQEKTTNMVVYKVWGAGGSKKTVAVDSLENLIFKGCQKLNLSSGVKAYLEDGSEVDDNDCFAYLPEWTIIYLLGPDDKKPWAQNNINRTKGTINLIEDSRTIKTEKSSDGKLDDIRNSEPGKSDMLRKQLKASLGVPQPGEGPRKTISKNGLG